MGAGFMLSQMELFEDGDLAATGRTTSLIAAYHLLPRSGLVLLQ